MSSTLITGGLVFDLHRPLERADVLVVDGEIRDVGPGLGGLADSTLDAEGMIIIPGLVNAHTHSNQTIEKGLADRLPLDSWMVLASYGGAGARLRPGDAYVSAMLGVIEMLHTGTTSVLDCARVDRAWFHDGMDAIVNAYVDSGMRAVVAAQYADLDFFSSIPIGMLADGTFPRREPTPVPVLLSEVSAYLDRWQGMHPLVEPAIAPSSLPRCSDDLFSGSIELAAQRQVKMQSHLLSAKSQVVIGDERFGGSTVAHLERIGGLRPWTSYAHGIWVADDEFEVLAAGDAVVVHNPISNLKLGAGLAPAPAMSRAGVTVALGSDGASSNDSQNMFETMKGAALVHRVAGTSGDWPAARDVLRWCWEGGAAAMGVRIGRVEPGYQADLVFLRPDHLTTADADVLARQLVYAELGGSVDTVLVAGDVLLRGGRLTQIDEDELIAGGRALADRIWSGLGEREERYARVRADLDALEAEVHGLDVGFSRSCS